MYDIKILNSMNNINDNKVNNVFECNLPHDMLNPYKHTKNINSHYSPILHVCMDTRNIKARFNNFRILLYSGYSSTIVMRWTIKNFNLNKTMWCNGIRKRVISQLIWMLKLILPYHKLVRRKLWHETVMWMTPLREVMIWSWVGIYEHNLG